MRKDKRALSKPSGSHDRTCVRILSAGVLFCAWCGAVPLSAAGSGPAPVLTPTAHQVAAPPARKQKSPATTVPAASQPAEHLTRELWSSRVTAPDPNEDAETRLALKRLIRQVRSVRFGDEASQPTAATPVEPPASSKSPKAEPVPVPQIMPPAATATAAALAAAGSPPAPRQRKASEGLLPDPGRTNDPLEIAELLFLSGRAADAAPFYAKALARLPPGEAATAADRAWTLFQLANCLRETNLGEAQATYTKLISEYPDSPWTELARAQNQLVSWYQKDQPQQLAASRRP